MIKTTITSKHIGRFFACLFLILLFFLFTPSVSAQSVSLSISPPILEAVVKPGDKIEQTYTLTNDGNETLLSVRIVPFLSSDEFGNVKLLEELEAFDPHGFKYWFELISPNLLFGEKFSLDRGEKLDLKLKISPPRDTPKGDYYFTLVFKTELDNAYIGQNKQASFSQGEIGTNILLTVSEDGLINKKAKIVEFSAPKIIDSFGKISYKVKVANIGSGFFKPFGKITIKPLFGKNTTLNLAPLNVITASTRQLTCLDNERLVPCNFESRLFLGSYTAQLSFEIDNDKTTYTKTITTFALPFSLLLVILSAIATLITIKKLSLVKKRKS